MFVVGDDAQSIYACRSAEVPNIIGFCHSFELPARVAKLARNDGARQPILDASNAVINLATEGLGKCRDVVRHRSACRQQRCQTAKRQLI